MLTQTVAGRVYDYSHSVGRSSHDGIGFHLPIAAAIGEKDVVYILSRGNENKSGVSIIKLTLLM